MEQHINTYGRNGGAAAEAEAGGSRLAGAGLLVDLWMCCFLTINEYRIDDPNKYGRKQRVLSRQTLYQ